MRSGLRSRTSSEGWISKAALSGRGTKHPNLSFLQQERIKQ
jgi:hypothetical protein